ncbi:MAG: hypothetical protein AB7F59_09530 [Bdellovibrionales bacterium]
MKHSILVLALSISITVGCQKKNEPEASSDQLVTIEKIDMSAVSNGECLEVSKLYSFLNQPQFGQFTVNYTEQITTHPVLDDLAYRQLAERSFEFFEDPKERLAEFSRFTQDGCTTVQYFWNPELYEEFKITQHSSTSLTFENDDTGYTIQIISPRAVKITYSYFLEGMLGCPERERSVRVFLSALHHFGASANVLPTEVSISTPLYIALTPPTEQVPEESQESKTISLSLIRDIKQRLNSGERSACPL